MTYWVWLAGISLVFAIAERAIPRRRDQRVLRTGIVTDVVYVIFNGHFLGVALAALGAPLEARLRPVLSAAGVNLDLGLARAWPLGVQIAVAFVALDFAQWCIHNLLHRVPWLWELHKVHHSILDLDWLGSMRFHWGEIVVYRALQYIPLALLGFAPAALFVVAVLGTVMGHFNHANVRVNLGPLARVLNSPAMHQWHHAHPDAGPVNKNFGISLAVWDWIFGTAYLPANGTTAPARLGFPGIEAFPTALLQQELWPLTRRLPR